MNSALLISLGDANSVVQVLLVALLFLPPCAEAAPGALLSKSPVLTFSRYS